MRPARSPVRTRTDQPAARRQLLSVKDLAEMLQVSQKTIYDWRYRGLGPAAIRVGRYVRYELDEIERWLDARRR